MIPPCEIDFSSVTSPAKSTLPKAATSPAATPLAASNQSHGMNSAGPVPKSNHPSKKN